jgi:hypothetical protein
MDRRSLAAVASVLALGLLLLAGAAYYALREQRIANRELLSRIEDVHTRLDGQLRQTQELADQVAVLNDRAARLEQDNRDLRRQVAALLRRKPVEVAAFAPAPVEAVALQPFSMHPEGVEPVVLVEPLAAAALTINWPAYLPGDLAPVPFDRGGSHRFTDPAFMKKMYVSSAVLHAVDVGTTLVALRMGAREANPFMRGVSRNPAALIAIKGGAAAGTIYLMKRLSLTNPYAAGVGITVINSALAIVAVNNVQAISRQKPGS